MHVQQTIILLIVRLLKLLFCDQAVNLKYDTITNKWKTEN